MSTAAPQFTMAQLQAIQAITGQLGEIPDLKNALEFVLRILHENLQMQRGMISVLRRESDEISVEAAFGLDERANPNVRYRLGEGVTGRVIATGRSIAIPSLDKAPFFLDRSGARRNLSRKDLAFLCVPVSHQGQVIGALSVDRAAPGNKTVLDQELAFLEFITKVIASRVFQFMIAEENAGLRRLLERNQGLDTIVGNSAVVRDLISQIRQVAPSRTTVLISGETGTGKELVASQIHQISPRRGGPMIKVNCGAIPEHLVESELFGHEKGSFTGATAQHIGKFEQAHGGTLMLDEIGELPMPAQVKLLRAIQDRAIERIGGRRPVPVDVRIVAATNRNLEQEVAQGRFREDLFYRINVFHIHVPPLRSRGADIMLLADYFIERYAREHNRTVTRIDTPAIDMLTAYHWPGNVRELENCIERAALLSEDSVIHAHHLPPSLQMKAAGDRTKSAGLFSALTRNYEIEIITNALKDSDGNQSKAARALGLTQRIMQYKIRQYGIDFKRFRARPGPAAGH